MSYNQLIISKHTPRRVQTLIRQSIDLSLSDVHSMLRLPINNYKIGAGCNFAITHVLMAVIGGISTTLYNRHSGRGASGRNFKGVLNDYYPWDQEPNDGQIKVSASCALYDIFRNPLTHDLGIDSKNKSGGKIVKVKRINRKTPKGFLKGLSEAEINALEISPNRPMSLSATIKESNEKIVLLVEGLYWGIRKMILNITSDGNQMIKADNHLKKFMP